MNRKVKCLASAALELLLGAALSGCAIRDNSGGAVPKQFVERQILVTLPDRLQAQWSSIAADFARVAGLEAAGEFPLGSLNVDCLVYKVPAQSSVEATLERLRADSRVVLTQANQVFEGLQTGESDPYGALVYAPKLIRADTAHRFTTGKGVKVAVVDTGADTDHPDLKGRIARTANFVEGGERSFGVDRHGTAVAGVIGARANDGVGIYGIAPDAEISVLKACGYSVPHTGKALCSSWTLAKAIDSAILNGARVINLSLAGPPDPLLSALLKAASMKGITIVAASAEQQGEPGFPASLDFVVDVVSSNAEGASSNPKWIEQTRTTTVAAPGVEVLTTTPREGYDFISGSSLAAAHVSGVVALLLERKPDLSPDQIRAALMAHSDRIDGSTRKVPLVDACRALQSSGVNVDCGE